MAFSKKAANLNSGGATGFGVRLLNNLVKEYYENKGEKISEKEISRLEKRYRRHEPEQFLIMYDAIRDKSRTDEN